MQKSYNPLVYFYTLGLQPITDSQKNQSQIKKKWDM